MATKLEQLQLGIIDVLLEHGGIWTGGDAQVLTSLASAITGDLEVVGSKVYKQVSLAVLGLEAMGLVQVDRRYADEAHQANIIERIVAL